jgi:ATP-dependent Clp protease protease subunit
MNRLLAKHTGQSEEAVEAAMSYDHYFDPEESLKFGLVDEIVDFGKLMEEC